MTSLMIVFLIIYCLAATAIVIDQRMTINDLRFDLGELSEIRNDLVLKLDQAVQDRRVLGGALVAEVEENL